MRKKALAIVSVVMVLFVMTGCSLLDMFSGGSSNSPIGVGETHKTEWFTFTVDSAKVVDSYEDYTPAEGNTLILVVITETSTVSDSLPMGTFDYDIIGPASPSTRYAPLDPMNDSMMPESFYLYEGETVTYDLLFEVPSDISDHQLVFVEYYDNNETGETYIVNLGL